MPDKGYRCPICLSSEPGEQPWLLTNPGERHSSVWRVVTGLPHPKPADPNGRSGSAPQRQKKS
ncbi:MAG: hypothetical protein ACPGJC_09000, partial [Pseudohongiellaceae bacterium]